MDSPRGVRVSSGHLSYHKRGETSTLLTLQSHHHTQSVSRLLTGDRPKKRFEDERGATEESPLGREIREGHPGYRRQFLLTTPVGTPVGFLGQVVVREDYRGVELPLR